ncbi:sensor histidine kinase [Salinisphaera hydrothermalis]|uniref:histidine kinase n=1 Tax=Salinisphaera hydrothermalis (strain C41B8) TaxID=1304275 RepID=A0A084IGM9_SALHC|nr:histidine kinase [Salinisphaera hydrothermalis C41B8]
MDGFRARLNDSLRLRLSFWLLVIIVGVAVVGGVLSFVLTYTEANQVQDDMLRQTAALFDAQHLPAPNTQPSGDTPIDPEARLRVALLPPPGAASQTASRTGFPPNLTDGLQTRVMDGDTYRIFVTALNSKQRIAVAQQTAIRDETAGYSALLGLLPFLVLVPLLLLAVTALVRRVFAPVMVAAAAVDRRSERDLQAVSLDGLPEEIRPFVAAINRLLGRVADAMTMQQRFIAAAAHELRSPLTALSLQAERLGGAAMSDDARTRVRTLRQGIDRNRLMLDQLLSYARAQSMPAMPTSVVSVHDLFRRVLAELMPLVEDKQIDIGVSGDDIHVRAAEVELTTVLRNLIANAVHYTSPAGVIDLRAVQTTRGVAITVEDNGPGLDPAERERVFEPFYRGLGTEVVGSGLGLSIVRTLVEQMNGHVELADAALFACGLRVTVILPAARA